MGDYRTRLTLIALFWLPLVIHAQKKELLSDPVIIQERVSAELAERMAIEDWQEFITEEGLLGRYTFEITIADKGYVVSVRALERSENGTIPQQNLLKDQLTGLRFGFKVPKGKRYKVQHVFDLQ